MKTLLVRLAKIVGTPDLKNWSWAYTFIPVDEEKKGKRGSLLAVLCLTGGQDNLTSLGREVLLRLHEEYYQETETPVFKRLALAVQKVCQEFSQDEDRLEITAAALVENICYLVSFGHGQAWVRRDDRLATVLKGVPGELATASGVLQSEDMLLLGTTSFFQVVSEGVLRAALQANDPNEAVESLLPLIHSQEQASQVAALVGKITQEPQTNENDIQEIEPSQETERFSGRIWGKIPEAKNRRMFFAIAIILIALLGTSLFFGAQKREQAEKQKLFTQSLEEATKLLGEGEALTVLNPARSREILFQAKTKIEEAESFKIEPARLAEIKLKVEEALGKVFKEYHLTEVPIFTDLTLMTPEGRGDLFSLWDNYLVVLDRQKNRVLGIDIQRKSGEVLAGGGSLEEASLLGSDENFVYVLEKEGVAIIEIKSKKIEKGKIKKDEAWGKIEALRSFGGNLYLLDSGKGEIWRYPAGSGSGQSWFGGTSYNLQVVFSMAIDGSIWLLGQEGKILKFTQGSPGAFGVAGLAKPLSLPTVIYTDDQAGNLYVLDKGNGRIVVLAKSGEYQAEYIWQGIGDASDMVVSEAEKKIFLLSGSKIYEIGLK